MPALYAFVDTQIRRLEQGLREFLSGEISSEALVRTSLSVIDEWKALPEEVRQGRTEAHEDVLWHAVWTTQRLADRDHTGEAAGAPLLHECLHLLESRAALPQHYVARRP